MPEELSAKQTETARLIAKLRKTSSRISRLNRQSLRDSRGSLDDIEDTRGSTLEKLLVSQSEIALFKAYLHTAYGIAIWDLYNLVEQYENRRTQKFIECTPDVGQHDKELLVLSETFYLKHLASDAKFFVDHVPSSYSLAIRDQLDRGIAPDCRALKSILAVGMCNDLGRFRKWLNTDEARREEARFAELAWDTSESFRGSFDSYVA